MRVPRGLREFRPSVPTPSLVMVWGDRNVAYGEVVVLMTTLQEAGAPSVGLVTDPPQ